MTLNKNEINRILETLPVGYYAKTKINVECVDGSQSYFDEHNEKIVVGVDTINLGLKNVPDDFDAEIAVRTVFYHEVSHLILTPVVMTYWPESKARAVAARVRELTSVMLSTQEAFDLINIVEDERIESALRNYYMNTNFRWFVLQQYHKGDVFTTPREIFYAAFRFRMGNEKILDAVSNLIITYKGFTHNISWVNTNDNKHLDVSNYLKDIATIYAMCVTENKNNEENNQNSKNNDDNKNSENDSSNEQSSSPSDSNENTENDESESDSQPNNKSKSESENIAGDDKDDEHENGDGENAIEIPDEELSLDEAKELFSKTFEGLRNDDMINEFKRIFKQFKTRGNVGGHTNAYSGVIDPRSAVRTDYKYFVRTNTENNGGSGKLHLNLWIDCSGSYSNNELVTNQIIKALEVVERENRVFTFDVMDINEGVHVHDKNKRYIKTEGCNYLCPEMDKQFKAMQKPDARNYNIVLYDGMAYERGQQKYFSAWNHDNVYIISDTSNEKPIRSNCKKAKTLFVSSWSCNKSYAEMLANKIYDILRIGFGA